ncbi:MAG: helix-turn-helix domain-containing protein [Thermomonas sp.]
MTTSPDNTHQAMAGCGGRLKQAREAAGLTVDDVASRLHMPARVVRSLEAEDWARLGAPVFVRGQVRSYSRLVGLTTAPMMAALDVGPVEPSHLVSRTHTPRAQWWAEQIGRRLVYIVLTLSLAVPAWVATRQHLSTDGNDAAPLDVPSKVGMSEPAVPVSRRTVMASMAPVASTSMESGTGEIILRIHAETWVDAVAADGSSLEKGLLPGGSERRFAAAQLSRLTIGNASAVDVQSGGQQVDLAPFTRTNVARFTVSSDGSLVVVD